MGSTDIPTDLVASSTDLNGNGPGMAEVLPSPNAAPSSQIPGNPSFRRKRANRACSTCHARKVRCDAASLGVPCTNCVAFSIECTIPPPKRKKGQGKTKDSDSDLGEASHERTPSTETPAKSTPQARSNRSFASQNGTPSDAAGSEAAMQASLQATYNHFIKPKFARAPIKDAGRVAYLGESSNLSLLVHDRNGTADTVHYPLPENVRGTRARLSELDTVEIAILHQRGACLLPPRSLCDELVDAYFRWVAPVVPVVNRSRFMRQYQDPENPPSLLLLQAILLAGSRVCTNPQLMDINGSTYPATMTFYKRAKALYDANYEDDRVTIVQALILMGWYWEGPEDVTKNVFYWSRVAIVVAQGSGMHRSVESSQLSRADKRIWKRIWWTLFTRDRSVAVALGRPVHINTEDSDVEMISDDDFIEDEDNMPAEYPPDPYHVKFFLQYVKLCEIMGLVLSQQYSVASKGRRQNLIDLTHSDMALADWLQNCPKEVSWERSRHHFWSALLHSNYYTALCLLHRAHMPPASSQSGSKLNGQSEEPSYPSKNIAFQAAAMITSIVENLARHGELRYCPAFIVYSLFSALIMHVYQMRSSIPSIVSATHEKIAICMSALKEVSKVWLVAKMVQTLFESILGNKTLEDKLHKAAGKRHNGQKPAVKTGQKREEHQKRKYDEMEITYTNGRPAPQVSYERSRPQTPAVTPSRDVGQVQVMTNMGAPLNPTTSPHIRQQNDTFMGLASRTNTRPPTPFNPSYSIPATPPDLFLVTRNSPPISQNMWENFQPDQLFPESTGNMMLAQLSASNIDPQLTGTMPQMEQQTGQPQQSSLMPPNSAGQMPQRPIRSHGVGSPIGGSMPLKPESPSLSSVPSTAQAWHSQFDSMEMPGSSQEDSRGNAPKGPSVPTTLNVEDWFQFFGINGDINGMNGEAV